MGRPKKVPVQAEAPKQTLLAIKPKPPEQPPEKPQEETVAKSEPTIEPEPATKPVNLVKPKQKKLPDIQVQKPVVEPQEIRQETPQQQREEQAQQQEEQEEQEEQAQQQEQLSFFQAVGILSGTIRFNEEGKAFVNLGPKEYPLYYIPSKKKRQAYDALIKEITATGNHNQRLIVYPRILHFPKKEQPHNVSFQLVGFDNGKQPQGVAQELQDFEFKLCGLWQFIPVCQTPCITVLRNFSQERLDYIKREETSALSKVKFMKASHVPVLWRDAPVRPFRFNPKLDKEQQGHPSFVEIKVRFLPNRDVFGFDSLLAPPADKPPRFFKARKEDKAEALKIKRTLQQSSGT
jgi:hypothetical protein